VEKPTFVLFAIWDLFYQRYLKHWSLLVLSRHKLLVSRKINVNDLTKSERVLTTFASKTESLDQSIWNIIFTYYFIFSNVSNILVHFEHGQHFLMKVTIAFYEIWFQTLSLFYSKYVSLKLQSIKRNMILRNKIIVL